LATIWSAICASVLPIAIFSTLVAAQDQVAIPDSASRHAYEASPEIYELLDDNDHFRIMRATWQPGQSDEWHTHHGDLVNYALTDCTLESQGPNGQAGTFGRAKGVAGFNAEGSIHKVANVGGSICILLIVERK
jgi:hypothetical protein